VKSKPMFSYNSGDTNISIGGGNIIDNDTYLEEQVFKYPKNNRSLSINMHENLSPQKIMDIIDNSSSIIDPEIIKSKDKIKSWLLSAQSQDFKRIIIRNDKNTLMYITTDC